MAPGQRRRERSSRLGEVQTKRAYEPPSATDGVRVLVDRLWPRGIRKDAARLNSWARDVAPSPGLCAWYGHAPGRFPEFRSRYRAELTANPDRVAPLVEIGRTARLTLVFGARDTERSNAAVLREFLEERIAGEAESHGRTRRRAAAPVRQPP